MTYRAYIRVFCNDGSTIRAEFAAKEESNPKQMASRFIRKYFSPDISRHGGWKGIMVYNDTDIADRW